jgi:VWFA-related protein
MAQSGKLDQAKQAAHLFLERLHARTDTGLLFFDHLVRKPVPPAGGPEKIAAHRSALRNWIRQATPAGGTAYLDATATAIDQLKPVKGRRAVVVMTDGVDLNSQNTLKEVIKQAQIAEVPVYTVGVGEAGKQEMVSTVLVLDCSGSMTNPVERAGNVSKLDAMKAAAARFVDLMRPGARTTLLPFSQAPSVPGPFQDDKPALIGSIRKLRAEGGTALYDAACNAVDTLVAAQLSGKRAVVLLTDGEDTRSRRRAADVIQKARAARVPLHVLGFGTERDLNERVLRDLAHQTGGTYHHARTAADLHRIFEDLSIQLHDDGIDEESLRELADKTGGKFFHARDAADLSRYFAELAEDLQSSYTVTFPSRRPTHDGTSRGIDISVVRDGVRLSDRASFDYHVHGVVVPDMDHRVYLGLLTLLGLLVVVPVGIRRLHRFYGGSPVQG